MLTSQMIASLPHRWIEFQKTSNKYKTKILINTMIYPKVCLYTPDNKYIYSRIEFKPLCNKIHPIEILYDNNIEAITEFEHISNQLTKFYQFNQPNFDELSVYLE